MADVELPNPEELEEQKGKTFTRRVALITGVFAVILAIASLGGNNATKDMILAQEQASDLWAFYQAKGNKEHQYHLAKLRAEMDLAERGARMEPQLRQRFEAQLNEMTEQERRYGVEKKALEADARTQEHERDLNRAKDPFFDFAEVFLQIAIVMSSISILSGSRPIFFFSLLLAIIGVVLTINGYVLFMKLA